MPYFHPFRLSFSPFLLLVKLLLVTLFIGAVQAEQAYTPEHTQELIAELAPGFRHAGDSDAYALLEQARVSGDGRYLGMAEMKLAHIENTVERELLKAEIMQGQHRFQAAEVLLKNIVDQQPGHRKALLMLAAIQRQQGRIDEAKKTCTRLLFIDQSLSQDCLFAAALGQHQHRFSLSKNRIGQNESNLWRDLLRAEFAETQGAVDQAHQLYRHIWRSNEQLTLEAWTQYAHFLRREERHFELKQLLRFAPASGELQSLKRFALNTPDSTALKEQINLLERHPNADRHAAEIAWFYHLNTDSAQWALHWAQMNWSLQRSLRDAELLVLTALVAGDDAAIDQVTEWMKRHRISDQRLLDLLQHSTALASIQE